MSTIDNIDGIYAKDTELRTGINTLRNNIINQTIKPLTVTQNGATYAADPTQGTYGYSPITVDVQEQPWQPLEDGYSNFWFELTNDTLSPWLNFSAKNNDAVIDWGDGSGEVALDTLTPTHTYSKAGKYVVKVKGVTGIAQQHKTGTEILPQDLLMLKAVELNSEVTSIGSRGFEYQTALTDISFTSSLLQIGTYAFNSCSFLRHIPTMNANTTLSSGVFRDIHVLDEVNLPANLQTIPSLCFFTDISLQQIVIPSTVTQIETQAFQNCYALSEVHIQATTPPTLGNSALYNLSSDFIIYVPVGTGDTYKAAAGWSAYADHILEEGQTPNRAMLSRLAVSDSSDTEESNER